MLSLITVLALESRDTVSSVDPDGSRHVFIGCPWGVPPSDGYDYRFEDDWRNSHDDADEHEEEWLNTAVDGHSHVNDTTYKTYPRNCIHHYS